MKVLSKPWNNSTKNSNNWKAGREARLVRLQDWETARLLGKPIITVCEGITEEDTSFLVKLQEKVLQRH